MDCGELLVLDLEDGEVADLTRQIIWNYYKVICFQSKKGDIKIVESKTLDFVIANFFYENAMQFNALPFNVADSPSFAVMVDQCIELCQQHPSRKYKAPN